MSQPIIVFGDKTSHGGTVITCSPFSDTDGRGWARVGDMVACPRCKGIFPISQGDPSLIDDGKQVAYEGCKTACGATLLSSQLLTLANPSEGIEAGVIEEPQDDSIAEGFGAIGAGMIAASQDEPLDESQQRFRGRFQVLDVTTGQPVAGQAVRIRSTGGRQFTGSTDADGFTEWIEHDAAEALAFELIERGQT